MKMKSKALALLKVIKLSSIKIINFINRFWIPILTAIIIPICIFILSASEQDLRHLGEKPNINISDSEFKNGRSLLHLILKGRFRNYGFKSGYIEDVKIIPEGLGDLPEIKVIYIDKRRIGWRETKELKVEFIIEMTDTYNKTELKWRVYFYDNAGNEVYNEWYKINKNE